MFWQRKRRVAPATVPLNQFGFGPYHLVFREHHIPGDQWDALRTTYDTELLPVEQRSGPAFENRQQPQTVRRKGEVSAVTFATGLQVLTDPGNPTGTFRQGPLTDINSAPGGIPINASGPLGEFVLPNNGL